jgi:hypothetical protein
MVFIGRLGTQWILLFSSLLPHGPQIAVRTSDQDIENRQLAAHMDQSGAALPRHYIARDFLPSINLLAAIST